MTTNEQLARYAIYKFKERKLREAQEFQRLTGIYPTFVLFQDLGELIKVMRKSPEFTKQIKKIFDGKTQVPG